MIKFIYDGSFDGFYTCVFEGYKDLEKIDIRYDDDQLDFISTKHKVQTDIKKSQRVKNSIEKYFGKRFLSKISYAFRSYEEERDNWIARTIKGTYEYGKAFPLSADINAVNFQAMVKNVVREIHSYKGLTRFREIDGNFLFAEIEPKNNIIDNLARHFAKRIPNENFIIYDSNRSIASVYKEGKTSIMEAKNLHVVDQKGPFEAYWVEFYKAISIEERKNLDLMQANMPKRYWKNLVER